MTGEISLLVAATVLILTAWIFLTVALFVRIDRRWKRESAEPTECRGYCCERTAADRLNPRNS
jgi:hypothetical protein